MNTERSSTEKIQRENIRVWFKTGVVKSIKVRSGEDDVVCDACRAMHGKIFPLMSGKEVEVILENIPIQDCTNPSGCRCYWRPEDISTN